MQNSFYALLWCIYYSFCGLNMIPVKGLSEATCFGFQEESSVENLLLQIEVEGTHEAVLLDEVTPPTLRRMLLRHGDLSFSDETIDRVFQQGWLYLNEEIAESNYIRALSTNTIMSALDTPEYAMPVATGLGSFLSRSMFAVDEAINADTVELSDALATKGINNLCPLIVIGATPQYGPHAGKIFGFIEPGATSANNISLGAIRKYSAGDDAKPRQGIKAWLGHYGHLLPEEERTKLLYDARLNSGMFVNPHLSTPERKVMIDLAFDGQWHPLQNYLARNGVDWPGGIHKPIAEELLSERGLSKLWGINPSLSGILNRHLPGHSVLGELDEDCTTRAFIAWPEVNKVKLLLNPHARISVQLLEYAAGGYDSVADLAKVRMAGLLGNDPDQRRPSNERVSLAWEWFTDKAPAPTSTACKVNLTSDLPTNKQELNSSRLR